ncbi:MAG TPA: hypothetical protein VI432_00330 [Candidatus Paceibacterota bacterium]
MELTKEQKIFIISGALLAVLIGIWIFFIIPPKNGAPVGPPTSTPPPPIDIDNIINPVSPQPGSGSGNNGNIFNNTTLSGDEYQKLIKELSSD